MASSSILQRITDIIFALDNYEEFTFLNTAAEDFFNSAGQALLGKNIWKEFPQLTNTSFYTSCLLAFNNQKKIDAEDFLFETQNCLEINIYPTKDGVTIFIKKISNKKSAKQLEKERILLEEAELPDKIINSLPGIFYMADSTPKLIRWNNAFENVTGFTAQELQQIAPISLFAPDDHETFKKAIEKAHAHGQANAQIKILNKSTHTIPYYFTAVKIDYKGNPALLGIGINVSEKIDAEKAVKEREEKYYNLFERASDIIAIHDIKGTIIDVNFAAADFSGFAKEELKRMKLIDLLFVEDLKHLPIPFDKLLAGETTHNRRRVKSKFGIERIMDVSSKIMPDGNIMAILRDVTEKTEAEKALRNSELRFRTLSENAPVGIFETNANGDTIFVNEKMMAYFGLSFDEMLGIKWMQAIHQDDKERLINSWKKNLHLKQESSSEYRLTDSFGNVKWMTGKTIPIFDKNEQFSGYLGTVIEITQEKNALFALKESEEKYRTLVEQASDAIYIADSNGKLITVNPSACKLSNYTEADLLQKNIYDFVSVDELNKNPFRFDELKQGKAVITERKLKGKSGIFFNVETTAKMLSDGRILVFAHDISARKKSEELLKKSYEDIRRLATHLTQIREGERKRIGREIHDELGQQITAVKMDVAWIDKKTDAESIVIKTKLKNIISLLDESNQSVRRILSELNPGVIDNHGLLEAIEIQNRQFIASTNIPITFKTSETKLTLAQEIANCIFRVYQESLTNIMKYAKAKTVVTSLKIINDNVVISIKDNGIGFDTTAPHSQKSFGLLGMNERVLSQNGIFDLQSEQGKGTTITITLPYKA